MVKHILVVGCGVTGAITAKLLKSSFESITIWEKNCDLGGRFNTEMCEKNNELSVDLGAQYITTTDKKVTEYDYVYSDLFSKGVIVEMQNTVRGMKESKSQTNVRNYVAPYGMKSIVKSTLDNVKCNIYFERKVTALYKDINKWYVLTECGKKEQFDVVIMTIPIPEILKLSGELQSLLVENKCTYEKLKDVTYSSRFALGFFFENGVSNDVDAEYIEKDPILRFIAYDSWKNNSKNKLFHSAVVHTTIQFGEKNNDQDLEDVKKIVIKQLTENNFQNWPKPSSVIALHWRHSQVLSPYDSKPGAITLCNYPLLIAGGDGFIGSNFDYCIYSSKVIVELVLKQLNK